MRAVSPARCAVIVGAIALAACQPSLRSTLPQGPAAYETIGGSVAPATGAYALQPGDKLSVAIFQEQDLSQPQLQIDDAGMISLPLVGELRAAGLTTTQLARAIEAAYGARFLREPQANVALVEARPRTVAVEGQVNRPGVFALQPETTLLSAMALAGSPGPDAKLDEVLIFRTINGERMGGRFDLTEIRSGRMPDPQLVAGDVVVVGFSSLRGVYRDILQAAPLLGTFALLNGNN